MSSVNGWPNWATWKCALVYSNYEAKYRKIQRVVDRNLADGTPYDVALLAVADAIRDDLDRGWRAVEALPNEVREFIPDPFSEINFVHVAEGFMEDYPRASRNLAPRKSSNAKAPATRMAPKMATAKKTPAKKRR